MNLQDLPHTCAYTWCCIQRDSGNKIMALPVLETREPLKFIGTKIYSQHKTYSSKVELRLQQYDGVVQYESNVLTYLHI